VTLTVAFHLSSMPTRLTSLRSPEADFLQKLEV
jgi:hypothetical protein